MKKAPIGVFLTDGDCYHLSWYDPDDGEGLSLGDLSTLEELEKAAQNPDDLEVVVAEKAARAWAKTHQEDLAFAKGLSFRSEAAARQCLSFVQQALGKGRPLFDWEEKALQQGWKPPKNWMGRPSQ